MAKTLYQCLLELPEDMKFIDLCKFRDDPKRIQTVAELREKYKDNKMETNYEIIDEPYHYGRKKRKALVSLALSPTAIFREVTFNV